MLLFSNESKTVYLNENQLFSLKESLSDVVFHYTSLKNMSLIALKDEIYFQSALANSADNAKTKELYYLSTTRQRNVNFGYSSKFKTDGARIEFDGMKLNQRFKGRAFDYWGFDWGKGEYNNPNSNVGDDTRRRQPNVESEDRIFSNEPVLHNARNYIKRVDIIVNKDDKYNLALAYRVLMKYGGITFIYDNLKDFNLQSKNTINNQLRDNDSYFDEFYYNGPNIMEKCLSVDTVADVVYLMLLGEVDEKNYNKEVGSLLRKYNLEKYLCKELFNRIRFGYNTLFNKVDTVQNDLQYVSRNPSKDGYSLLKMWTTYFKNHNFRTYKDFTDYKNKITKANKNYSNEKKRFMVINDRIIVPNPNETSFWLIYPNKRDFVEDLYYEVENYGSRDKVSFKKYLQHLTHNDISITNMLDILNKLNVDVESFFNIRIEYRDLDLYDIDGYYLPQYKGSGGYGDKNYYKNREELQNLFAID